MDQSHYCSKECQRLAWPEHRLLHKKFKAASSSAGAAAEPVSPWREKFDGYEFTGALRPYAVSPVVVGAPGVWPKRAVPDYAVTGVPKSELAERGRNIIAVYSPAELATMRRAGELAREVLDEGARAVRVGATGDEIDRIVHAACVARSVYPSPLNYHGFPKSVCVLRGAVAAAGEGQWWQRERIAPPSTPPHPHPLSCVSVNEVICHGIPDARPLRDGDIVNIDVTVCHEGFHSDLNETFFVGAVDERGRALVRCAYDALAAAVALCKPGVFYRDLGDTITRVAHGAGFTVVKSYCGHGVGRLFHTAPNVPHYAKNKAVGIMRAGHVFTIEPMINEGTHGDTQWPDGWTVVTRDGKRSAQFEHTLVVTDTGVELLTARAGAPRGEMVWDEAYVSRSAGEAAAVSK